MSDLTKISFQQIFKEIEEIELLNLHKIVTVKIEKEAEI